MEEYLALETVKTSCNFDGLADASSEKPKRKVDTDAEVQEQPVFTTGAAADEGAECQVEGAAIRAKHGFSVLGADTSLAHRFNEDTLRKMSTLDTAERVSAFVRALKQLPLMASATLPPTACPQAAHQRGEQLRADSVRGYRFLGAMPAETLRAFVELQRKAFGRVGARDKEGDESDTCAAPPARPFVEDATAGEAHGRFIPGGQWQRPSDYVRFLAQRFERGPSDPVTGAAAPRQLKRDQALFVARFAQACNDVWEDERRLREGTLAVKDRRCFQFLLMGQGGSGKTALVQDIVLPAMEAIFPAGADGTQSTLMLCSKWSQAENISTREHRAVTCHRAARLGVQSYRNKHMQVKTHGAALRKTWEALRCLILEEVSMMSPHLYNMVAYRAYLGRFERREVQECEYDTLRAAFGRMPIVIHLGDFLQLKPTGCSGVSLLSDFGDLAARSVQLAPEFQAAMKLCCSTPLCFQLQRSNRATDPVPAAMLDFIRNPYPNSSIRNPCLKGCQKPGTPCASWVPTLVCRRNAFSQGT